MDLTSSATEDISSDKSLNKKKKKNWILGLFYNYLFFTSFFSSELVRVV